MTFAISVIGVFFVFFLDGFMAKRIVFVVFIMLWLPVLLPAQTPQTRAAQDATSELKLDTGKEIFEAACIACHGPNGKGQPQTTL